jgi:hypothetical protein
MGDWRYSFTFLGLSARRRGVVTLMSLPFYPEGRNNGWTIKILILGTMVC